MQIAARRSQKDRSDAMRASLLEAGRKLFVRNGYSATGTPEIVAAAGVTRGALYHHFRDKQALFFEIVRAEAEAVAAEIEAADYGGLSLIETLIQGGEAFLAAMRAPGRARLMLVEAPAVLGQDDMAEIGSVARGQTFGAGLRGAGVDRAEQLAALLSAAYDHAALAIDRGDPPGPWLRALERLVRGVVA